MEFLNYWKDSLQTFEYNTISGLDESKKVLFSTLFKSTGVFGSYKATLNTSDISIELNEIGKTIESYICTMRICFY